MINRNMKRAVFVLYVAVLLFLSFYKFNKVSVPGGDKLHHLAAYVVYGFIFYYTFQRKISLILSGILLGIFVEIVQYYLPYRSFELKDILADVAGIIISIILILIIKKGLQKKPLNM